MRRDRPGSPDATGHRRLEPHEKWESTRNVFGKALYAEMNQAGDDEAEAVKAWLDDAGFTFHFGADEATEPTLAQVRSHVKMYIAAVRLVDDFGADAIGIQYQQGLKDLLAASDLAEGLLNNVQRPPVLARDGSRELFEGRALPHFNEMHEGVAVDALVTNRIWTAMGLDPANTLHDVRWGEEYDGKFVWGFHPGPQGPAGGPVLGGDRPLSWRKQTGCPPQIRKAIA